MSVVEVHVNEQVDLLSPLTKEVFKRGFFRFRVSTVSMENVLVGFALKREELRKKCRAFIMKALASQDELSRQKASQISAVLVDLYCLEQDEVSYVVLPRVKWFN